VRLYNRILVSGSGQEVLEDVNKLVNNAVDLGLTETNTEQTTDHRQSRFAPAECTLRRPRGLHVGWVAHSDVQDKALYMYHQPADWCSRCWYRATEQQACINCQ
jgi:hypothetical protein